MYVKLAAKAMAATVSVSPLLQFTNMGRDFQGTLDYVLYTTNSLVPTATLELPEESDLKDIRQKAGLPNETWSSDHIALLAEFQYKHS